MSRQQPITGLLLLPLVCHSAWLQSQSVDLCGICVNSNAFPNSAASDAALAVSLEDFSK
jgi:hypothetical protein